MRINARPLGSGALIKCRKIGFSGLIHSHDSEFSVSEAQNFHLEIVNICLPTMRLIFKNYLLITLLCDKAALFLTCI